MKYTRITDGLHFASTLTTRKVINAMMVVASYLISRIRRKPILWGMPLSLSIEPTTHCNLRCPQCPSGLRQFTRNTGMLDPAMYESILHEVAPDLTYLILYFQGEPFLHPQFLSLIRTAASKGIYTATSSNAHYFDDATAKDTIASGLSRLVISVDGTTQASYQHYRVGGSLDKVIEGTRNLIRWKHAMRSQTPHIIWQFIAFRHNEHEVDEVKRMGRDIGVDEVRIKTAQIYDYEQSVDFIPDDKDLSRYEQRPDGTWAIRNKLLNHCWRMWRGSVVSWDGLVVPCCYDKDATHRMGDLRQQHFHEVWTSPVYHQFRSAVLRSRREIDICTNCTEGTKVWS